MAIELRLSKDDPFLSWGFRLTGGSNFDLPLTTIKVVENSIAQECGLQVGDIIVKINDEDITTFTHAQAHDRIIQTNTELFLTVVRGEMSDQLKALIEREENPNIVQDSEDLPYIDEGDDINQEIENLLEGSVAIDYPDKTLEDLIKDQEQAEQQKLEKEVEKQTVLPKHDLNLTDEEIHSIISPEIVTSKEKSEPKPIGPPVLAKAKLEAPQVLQPEVIEDKIKPTAPITTDNVKFMQSQIIAEINNNLLSSPTDGDKRWSTFLQKPKGQKPVTNSKFEVQKSTYRVKIRTKKDLEAEKAAKIVAEEAEALRLEQLAVQEAIEAEIARKEEEAPSDDTMSDSSFSFSDSSDNPTESTITFTPSGTEPTISFTESLNSLEGKLEQVKEQLQVYNVDLVPDALTKLLTKIASQLEKIVKVVKPHEIAAQNGDAGDGTDDDADYEDFSDDESSATSSLDSHISTPTPSTPSYQGTEPTLTFSSFSIMSDPQSPTTPEGTEASITFSDEHADIAECDRTEYDVTEMQDYQEEVAGEHKKTVDDGRTPKKEKVENWNRVWPWTHVTQPIYRINFLKYQPPPKNLDHLKNSEVYKMVHNMGPEGDGGIFGRPAKVLSEQDYHVDT